MKLDYPEIRNWFLTPRVEERNPYIAPECTLVSLCGDIYGSAQAPDGKKVLTSPIVRAIEEQGVIIIETQRSKYIIREENIDPGYVRECGNVWATFLEEINK